MPWCALQDAPFFTVKLNVKVLPCLIMFSGGVAADRVAGFDDFGAKDSFSTDSGESKHATGVTWPSIGYCTISHLVCWHQMGSS